MLPLQSHLYLNLELFDFLSYLNKRSSEAKSKALLLPAYYCGSLLYCNFKCQGPSNEMLDCILSRRAHFKDMGKFENG